MPLLRGNYCVFGATVFRRLGFHHPRYELTRFKAAAFTSFRQAWVMAGVPKDMRDQLAGHSDKSAGAGYEHGQPVEAMKAAIKN